MARKYSDREIRNLRTDLVGDRNFRSDLLAYMYMNFDLTILDKSVQQKLSEFITIHEKVGSDLLTIINSILHPGTLPTSPVVTDMYLFLLKAKMYKKAIDVISVVYPSYGKRDTFTIADYGDAYADVLALTHVIEIARYCNMLDDENLRNGRPRYTDDTDVTSNQIETAYGYILGRFGDTHADHFAHMIGSFKIIVDALAAPNFTATCWRLGITL